MESDLYSDVHLYSIVFEANCVVRVRINLSALAPRIRRARWMPLDNGHDGDTLGVDGAQVGVFEETDEVSLGCLLKGHDGRGLETEIGLDR